MIVEMENIKENIQLKRPEIRKWIWVEFFFDELLCHRWKNQIILFMSDGLINIEGVNIFILMFRIIILQNIIHILLIGKTLIYRYHSEIKKWNPWIYNFK